jgi:hypothetical protein
MNCYEIKTHKPIFANHSIHSSKLKFSVLDNNNDI